MGASTTTRCQLNEHVALRADNFACHCGERDPLGRQLNDVRQIDLVDSACLQLVRHA